ncbi:hypothetical protein MRBLMS1_002511 [Massilia sp. LMS1-1-1.1]
MPSLELNDDALTIRLALREKLASFQGNLCIPLQHVRGATDDDGFRGAALGLRAPGTNLPGVISAGTYHKGGDRQFVFMTRGMQPLVIELQGEKWARLVLGVPDARAMAARINALAMAPA